MKISNSVYLLVAFMPMLVWGQTSITELKPQIRAIVIGIAQYKDHSVGRLKFAGKDAQDFYKFLQSPSGGSVLPKNIALLVDTAATRRNIIKAIKEKFKPATSKDLLIFYFSGHGEIGTFGDGYLATYDMDNDDIDGTGLPMNALDYYINFNAKMKLTYIDACHAGLRGSNEKKGALTKGDIGTLNYKINKSFTDYLENSVGGNISMLSSQERQESIEYDKLQNGVFTYYLLKGLYGEADLVLKNDKQDYKDGFVTARELMTYLDMNVTNATQHDQIPTFRGAYNSDFKLSLVNPDAEKDYIESEAYTAISKDGYNPIYGDIDQDQFGADFFSPPVAPSFDFVCPVDTVSDSIDINLIVKQRSLINKIAYFRISIEHQTKKPNNDTTFLDEIFNRIYLPQFEQNKFRVPNYLKRTNTVMEVGYVLKSHVLYPRFDKIECRSKFNF